MIDNPQDKQSTTAFLSGELPRTIKQVTCFYDRYGQILSEQEYHKSMYYAKHVEPLQEDGEVLYYARVYQGALFDPMGPYGRRQRDLDTQMRRVSKNTFDLYMTYLKTNNSIYLTKAQRGFLND